MKRLITLCLYAALLSAVNLHAQSAVVPVAGTPASASSSPWSYQITLTVDHTQCGGSTSSNFPVEVSLSNTVLKVTGSGGQVTHTGSQSGSSYTGTMPYDVQFTSDAGNTTLIPWEIESYSGTAGTLIAHVKTACNSSSDTVFYGWAGNSSVATQQNTGSYSPANVWDSNFKMVHHYPDGTTLNLKDSTANANDGTNNNSVVAAAGLIDGTSSFSGAGGGTQQSISVTYSSSLKFGTGDFSVSAWVNTSDVNANNEKIFVGTNRFAVAEGWLLEMGTGSSSPSKFTFATYGSGGSNNILSSQTINDGAWHHLVAVRSGTSILLYADGSSVGSGSVSGGYNSDGGGGPIFW